MILKSINNFYIKNQWRLVFFVILTGSILIFLRNNNLLPMVMSDEYYHQLNSRFLNMQESLNSNYFFNYIYGVTNFCGASFYNCAKIINIFFFAGGSIFLFSFLNTFRKDIISFIISICFFLGPLNSYTSYFVQESMTYFLFWGLSLFFLKTNDFKINFNLKIIFLVFSFFIIDLTKSYGIFFILSIIIFLFLKTFVKKNSFLNLIKNIILILFIYFGLKYLFLTLYNLEYFFFGKLHETSFKKDLEIINIRDILIIIKFLLINLYGHFVTFLSIFGLIIFLNLIYLENQIFDKKKFNYLNQFYLFCLISLIVLIGFSALINSINQLNFANHPYESIFRIHARYYFFLIPILLVPLFDKDFNLSKIIINKKLFYIFLVIFVVFLISYNFLPFRPYKFDNPYLRGLTWNSNIFLIVNFILVINIYLFLNNKKFSINLFIIIIFPLITLISTLFISNEMLFNKHKNANLFNQIGLNLKYKNINFDKTLILGNYEPGLYEILWHLNSKNAKIKVIDYRNNFKIKETENDLNFLVFVKNNKNIISVDDYKFYYVGEKYYILKKFKSH